MNEEIKEKKHDVQIKSRKRVEMSGISDVNSFDETEIVIQTDNCGVSIEGECLKIERFNAETGDLIVNGEITGLFYYTKQAPKRKKSITDWFTKEKQA